jgi:hypothetical protein
VRVQESTHKESKVLNSIFVGSLVSLYHCQLLSIDLSGPECSLAMDHDVFARVNIMIL